MIREIAEALDRRLALSRRERVNRAAADVLPRLVCVDVGASYYPHPAWELFRRSSRTTWIAVEPNEANAAYVRNWRWPSTARLEPRGLSETGGEQTLHVTNVDSGSSLLPPVIAPDMEHRVHNREYFFPVQPKPIATTTLDAVLADPSLAGPAVVKLDTQGTELSILRGAHTALGERRVVGIESEATMLAEPVMKGSGKFWQLCEFLEANDFELMLIEPIEGVPESNRRLRGRTCVNECDAVFALKQSVALAASRDHALALVGFYLCYRLFEEAAALVARIDGAELSTLKRLLGA